MNNKEVKTMVRYNHRVFSGDCILQSEVMQEFSSMESAAKALYELVSIDKKHNDQRSLWSYTNDGTIVSWSYNSRDYRREVTYWEIELEGGKK